MKFRWRMYMKTIHTNIIFLLLIVILSCLFFVLYPSKRESFDNSNVEIIISRYNESLDWITEQPFNAYSITVYNKGPNDNFEKTENITRIIPVKNVGRCDHTYLYHIVNNYDNLAEINVFLPGSCNMEYKKYKAKTILENIEKHEKAVFISDTTHENVKSDLYDFVLDEWVSSEEYNKYINPEKKLENAPIRPFGKWYESNFGDIVVKNVTYQAIFSISKKDILNHPLEYYKNLMVQLETSSNPEVGHYMERAWAAVFHPINNTQII